MYGVDTYGYCCIPACPTRIELPIPFNVLVNEEIDRDILLGNLPHQDRKIFEVMSDGNTQKEAAEELGVTQGYISSALKKADRQYAQGNRFWTLAPQKYLDKPHIKTPFENVYIFGNFVRDEGFFEGDYTFQSVGSVAICSAICAGQSLLDACAAPGGKSVLLSKKFKSVTACELHAHRVELINSYAQRMGASNVHARQTDSAVYNPDYAEAFDAVLCDVPCSGTGVINENPDIKLFRKESDIESLNVIQLKILENCSRYVKSGGTLYYSTCSVLPEENDSIVYKFLQLHPEYALNIPVSPLEHRTTRFGLQFLPHISLGAGFFLTSFIKQ